MRESVGIPAGILAYAVAVVMLLLTVKTFFAAPKEWPNLITVSTAVVAFQATCAVVRQFSTELGVKIVGVMIAIFWLVTLGFDAFGLLDRTVDFLGGNNENDNGLGGLRDFIELVWDSKVCAGVSVLLALWTLAK